MNKTTLLATLLLLVVSTLTGCADRPSDGDLDRQWQLMEITAADGTVTHPAERTYYCFYREVAQINIVDGTELYGILHYVAGKSLSIDFPENTAAEIAGAGLPVSPGTDSDATGLTVSFGVVSITSSRLVLSTEADDTYTFRAF